MSKLMCKINISLASMMIANLDPRKSKIDYYKEEILRLLPIGTEMIGLQEIVGYYHLARTFELTFDCPFFKKDFEFDVEFKRNVLTDGEVLYTYDTATEIIKLDEGKKNG